MPQTHTNVCKRNKAMEFFNLYSQSRIQSELKFCCRCFSRSLSLVIFDARCTCVSVYHLWYIRSYLFLNVDLQYKLLGEWPAWLLIYTLCFLYLLVDMDTQWHDTNGQLSTYWQFWFFECSMARLREQQKIKWKKCEEEAFWWMLLLISTCNYETGVDCAPSCVKYMSKGNTTHFTQHQ